jgi:hypothetical protein
MGPPGSAVHGLSTPSSNVGLWTMMMDRLGSTLEIPSSWFLGLMPTAASPSVGQRFSGKGQMPVVVVAEEVLAYSSEEVFGAAKRLRGLRRKGFRICRMCGVLNPPEWLMGGDDDGEIVCQSCAESKLGVVF